MVFACYYRAVCFYLYAYYFVSLSCTILRLQQSEESSKTKIFLTNLALKHYPKRIILNT